MTDDQHNRYIAWAFLGHGAFQFLMLLLLAVIFWVVSATPDPSGQPEMPPEFFAVIMGFGLILYSAFGVPPMVAAYALVKRKSWARIASIVAGVLSATSVPFGTLACVYSLWFFLGENWKTIYSEAGGGQRMITEPATRWDPYYQNDQGETVYRNVDPPDWR